jgi:hypothetical protein
MENQEKRKRGRPKGIPRAENAGRKATGRVRNKGLNILFSEKEREEIYKILDTTGLTRAEGILKIFNEWKNMKK